MDTRQAQNHAFALRLVLLDRAGVPDDKKADDKRSLYEIATAALRLTTHHDPKNALFQSALQVIDDFVLATKDPPA